MQNQNQPPVENQNREGKCIVCARPLKFPSSVARGMGPVCTRKHHGLMKNSYGEPNGDFCDLPFDAREMDIVCSRELFAGEPTGERRVGEVRALHFNIPQTIFHHSPTGFEWGYPGTGPADFALNILHVFCRDDGRPPVDCYRGQVSRTAWDLHQVFKSDFIETLPRAGGTISGAEIRAWLTSHAPPPLLRPEDRERGQWYDHP